MSGISVGPPLISDSVAPFDMIFVKAFNDPITFDLSLGSQLCTSHTCTKPVLFNFLSDTTSWLILNDSPQSM